MSKRLPGIRALTGVAVVGALVFAGIAIADHVAASTQAVSATFTATTVADLRSATCTGADGTYAVTNALYSGTSSSSDARLNGPIQLHVRSVYNTTKNLGRLDANIKVQGATVGHSAQGFLHAVNTNGQLQGLLIGGVHGPNGGLLANVSAGFTSGGGFTSGQLGTGTAANTALVFTGGCRQPENEKHHGHHKHHKH